MDNCSQNGLDYQEIADKTEFTAYCWLPLAREATGYGRQDVLSASFRRCIYDLLSTLLARGRSTMSVLM